MLYGFHAWQNDKRSGTVHATYMVYGAKKVAHANGHSQQDGDVEMSSSSPDVEGAAEEDLQLLADVSKPFLDVPTDDGSVDPPKPLGAIHNPYVRRRERRGLAQKPVAPPSKPSNAKPPAAKHASATEPAPAAKAKEEAKADQKPTVKESTPVPSGANKPAPAPKRGASGGIMQSFAKAASMPKKRKTTSQTAASSAVEDSSTQALSDDGEDDSAPAPEPQHESEATRKSRKERQEELRRMMEEDSEDDEPEKEDTPIDELEEEAPAPEPEKKEEPEPAEVISNTADGRRRGKRRVMKKKTVMDDQGYLGKLLHLYSEFRARILILDPVTVQEQGWESFSEDEPAPPPKVMTQLASHPAKAKKPAPKGQGNIMSFFSKK
ncbi:CDC27 protein [Cytospora paraplurivora]|uniref:CDC27 protein n=1 Tax=Cytospora paraplurivora TaxID=2898453 RepID=A0AAN9UJ35_9PEZI